MKQLVFYLFEFLYAWPVRGPLDILKEEWQGFEKNQTNVLAYVQGVREKLERVLKLAGAVLNYVNAKVLVNSK